MVPQAKIINTNCRFVANLSAKKTMLYGSSNKNTYNQNLKKPSGKIHNLENNQNIQATQKQKRLLNKHNDGA